MMTSNRQAVSVQSKRIAPCMTCPICKKLLKNATTSIECLHTFCRKCIYKKITEEELDSCPECNAYLGCAPLEKLRADHLLQDMRTAVFASLRRRESNEPEAGSSDPLPATMESKEHEVVPSIPLPGRRKERSLSSLVSPPKASNQTVTTGRRKPATRKVPASRGSTLSIEEPIKKVEDKPESSSPSVTPSKITQNKKQNSSAGESSKQQMPCKGAEDPVEPLEGMTDLWKPLNCLVEAAGITKSSKSPSSGSVVKLTPPNVHQDEAQVNKTKFKERANKSKVHDDEQGSNPVMSGSVKHKKIRGGRQKGVPASEGSNISSQAVVNAASNACYRRVNPIWFSLIASDAQEGDPPLPQIPSGYLRIVNPNLPVLFIQKYLVKKLDLSSESEVEITLQGQPVPPTLQLYNLVDVWLQTTPKSERIETTVGSSGKDFVMVLHYGRKAAQPS